VNTHHKRLGRYQDKYKNANLQDSELDSVIRPSEANQKSTNQRYRQKDDSRNYDIDALHGEQYPVSSDSDSLSFDEELIERSSSKSERMSGDSQVASVQG
jgi:hypothetical protein